MSNKIVDLIFIGAMLFVLSGCGAKNPHTPAGVSQAALSVALVSPQVSNWPMTLIANGRIDAWQYSIIGSELSGVPLREAHAEVGDQVKKGQILAVFDRESIEIDLLQSRADYLEAKSVYEHAFQQAKRIGGLKGTGSISQDEIEKSESNAIAAEARLDSARARMKMQEFRLSRVEVRASDEGVIVSSMATVGSVPGAGTELYRLIRKNRLEWRANVTSEQLPLVTVGQKVLVEIKDGYVVPGTVRKISPQLDSKNLTSVVYVDLPESAFLKAGMFASGVIQVGAHEATYVPENALVYRDGYKYLVEVDENSRAHFIKVESARRNESNVEITTRLNDGVRLVASGGNFLVEGDLVDIRSNIASILPPNGAEL